MLRFLRVIPLLLVFGLLGCPDEEMTEPTPDPDPDPILRIGVYSGTVTFPLDGTNRQFRVVVGVGDLRGIETSGIDTFPASIGIVSGGQVIQSSQTTASLETQQTRVSLNVSTTVSPYIFSLDGDGTLNADGTQINIRSATVRSTGEEGGQEEGTANLTLNWEEST